MNIDNEIKQLEARLQELKNKRQFNFDAIENNNITFISIFDYSSNESQMVKNFNELFNFLKKKIKKSNKLILDYRIKDKNFNNEFSEINDNVIKEIMGILCNLDGWIIHYMDFGIVNKKKEFLYNIYFHSEFLDKLNEVLENKTINGNKIDEKTYFEIIDKSKEYRICNNE